MRLLHVVFVACLENAALALLIVKEPELHLDVHWVLKLFDSLLHRPKVAREVVLGLLFDERKYDGQLVEEVVDGVQDRVQWQIGVSRKEKLMLHQDGDLNAELLLAAR